MRRILVSTLALLALAGGSLGFGQDNFSGQTVHALHVEGWGADDVLRRVATQADLKIGLELDVVMGKEGHVELDFAGGTVTDLAVKCAALVPGGSWKIVNDRSLLIYVPGKATSFSALRIGYPARSHATRRQIWDDLSNRAEIADWLQPKDCKQMEIWSSDRWRGDGMTISMPSGPMNLGDVLEIASSQSNNHYWSILANSRAGQCEIWMTLW
jgi:hypothetical protein